MNAAPDHPPVDLLVIGGGINGVGIARDAAGRGLSVLLVEQGDLAGATSSASTKLIHGGLRYLEHRAFRLVREALQERERLLGLAPHLVRPLDFVLPVGPDTRPAWMLRLGLLLYDGLGGRHRLQRSRGLDLARCPEGVPLRPAYRRGFRYADCWVDDARLVALNAVDLAARGGRVLTRTACVGATPVDGRWHARLACRATGTEGDVVARAIVNATGPWVGRVLAGTLGINAPAAVRLVKGSHIVVARLYQGEHAYTFQNGDGRVVFAIPYEDDYTLIGTTDIALDDDPDGAMPPVADAAEVRYLCDAVSRYFARPVEPGDVVWHYSGVRPLYDDGRSDPSAVTRDYVLQLDERAGAPVLSVYGGKITTYRRLAEQAAARLLPRLGGGGADWTGRAPLPGADMEAGDPARHADQLADDRPGLDRRWLHHLVRRHGSRAGLVLGEARTPAGLGRHFGGGLYEREVDHLMATEWAVAADDVLWRRTKFGLRLDARAQADLAEWMAAR